MRPARKNSKEGAYFLPWATATQDIRATFVTSFSKLVKVPLIPEYKPASITLLICSIEGQNLRGTII